MSSHTPVDLNAEIERIEAGIVQRELRVRGRVHDLTRRVDAALPKVMAAGVAATAIGLLVLWLRPRPRAVAPSNDSGADGGWLRWANLAWPLLPLSLRAIVDLRLINALGAPLLTWWKGRKQRRQSAVQKRPADGVRKRE